MIGKRILKYIRKFLDQPFLPSPYMKLKFSGYRMKRIITYQINSLGRMFMILEDGSTSLVSALYGFFIQSVVLLVVITNILASDTLQYGTTPDKCDDPVCYNEPLCPNKMICEPKPLESIQAIEDNCIYILTIDYAIRILLCWSVPPRLTGLIDQSWDEAEEFRVDGFSPRPEPMSDPPYTVVEKIVRYMIRPYCIIDFAAFLPNYIKSSESGATVFVRLLRIIRIVRLLRFGAASRNTARVLSTAVFNSSSALLIMGVVSLLVVIVFGAIMFLLESGDFRVTEEFPNGEYYARNTDGTQWIESSFNDIGIGIYWAVVTMATLGYGEAVPTTVVGRAVTVCLAFIGVITLSIPVTVLGHFYSEALEENIKARENEKLYFKNAVLSDFDAASSVLRMNVTDSASLKLSDADSDPSRSFLTRLFHVPSGTMGPASEYELQQWAESEALGNSKMKGADLKEEIHIRERLSSHGQPSAEATYLLTEAIQRLDELSCRYDDIIAHLEKKERESRIVMERVSEAIAASRTVGQHRVGSGTSDK